MFKTRVISGIFLIVILGACFYLGGIALCGLMCVVSLIGMQEYYKAVGIIKEDGENNALTVAGYAAGLLLYAILYLFDGDIKHMIFVPVLLIAAELCIYVFTFPKYRIENITLSLFAFLYVALSMSFVYIIREMEHGIYLIWLVLFASWISDTFAYLTGMLLGKHKLAPVLSPKKSIEGSVGGVVFAALFAAIYGYFIKDYIEVNANPAIVFAIVCGVGACFSQIGDLAASAIKRNYDIKDYGKLIPGHGGILDRFDSVIFAAPMIYLVAYLFM